MQKLQLTKQDIIKMYKEGKPVKMCSGLWNDPRTKSRSPQSVEDIESFYSWAAEVEVKQYDYDITIYIHGYSECDMF